MPQGAVTYIIYVYLLCVCAKVSLEEIWTLDTGKDEQYYISKRHRQTTIDCLTTTITTNDGEDEMVILHQNLSLIHI